MPCGFGSHIRLEEFRVVILLMLGPVMRFLISFWCYVFFSLIFEKEWSYLDHLSLFIHLDRFDRWCSTVPHLTWADFFSSTFTFKFISIVSVSVWDHIESEISTSRTSFSCLCSPPPSWSLLAGFVKCLGWWHWKKRVAGCATMVSWCTKFSFTIFILVSSSFRKCLPSW